MKIKIGISSCPNDTFVFDAIFNHRIDCKDIDFQFYIGDIEELNRIALEENIDICKISFGALAQLTDKYYVLESGNALGYGQGPLLIAKKHYTISEINHLRIAIPGKNTTANFLMSIFFPKAQNKDEFLFSNIEKAVLSGDYQAGVIIHESRFTYQNLSLVKLYDLGEMWEQATAMPIPLGCIVGSKKLPCELLFKIQEIIKESIMFALDNPLMSKEFVKNNAQIDDESIIQKHIDLYVSKFTENLGLTGKQAIKNFLQEYSKINAISISDELFLPNY